MAEEAEVVVWTVVAVVEAVAAAWAEAAAVALAWVAELATGSALCQTAITRTLHGGTSAIAARRPGQRAWVTIMMMIVVSVEVCVDVVVTEVVSVAGTEEVSVVAVAVVTEVASGVETEEVTVAAGEETGVVASGDVEAWTAGAVVVDPTGDPARSAETNPIEQRIATQCTCSGPGQAAPWQLASFAALPALAA